MIPVCLVWLVFCLYTGACVRNHHECAGMADGLTTSTSALEDVGGYAIVVS